MKPLKSLLLAAVILVTTLAATPRGPAATVTLPKPSYPAKNALVTDYTPTLKWSVSTSISTDPVTDYDWEVSDVSTFATTIDSGNVAAPAVQDTVGVALDPQKTYYWRVRATHATSGTTAWTVSYFRTAILPPALTAPADASILPYNRPTFEWGVVTGATSYTLQISYYSNFKSVSYSYTISYTLNEYTMLVDLPANKVFYWRMRANSSAFGPSAWSAIRSFTTASPPSVPVLLQPRTGKITDDYTPLLVWKEVTAAAAAPIFGHYEIQIATTDKFESADIVNTLDDADIANLANIDEPYADLDTFDLDPATTYYWRVRAYNSLLQYSNWSKPFELRTSPAPVTTLNAPTDEEVLAVNCPVFDWAPADGAKAYVLEISRNASFSSIVQTLRTKGATTATCKSALPVGTTLYWRVRGFQSGYSYGHYSGVRTFTTANPPSVPRVFMPSNNSLTKDYTPTLGWVFSSVPTGKTFDHYQVQVSLNDSSFASTVVDDSTITNVLTNTLTLTTALDPGSLYYWHVRACAAAVAGPPVVPMQCSGWSSTFKLRTSIETPINLVPATGSTFSRAADFPIILQWDPVLGALRYTIQISKTSKFTSKWVYTSYVPTLTIPSLPLGTSSTAITYYWRVIAENKLFGPTYSGVNTFTVTP
jgi:hypothetical protein